MKKTKSINLFFVDNDTIELDFFRENIKIDHPLNLYTYSSPEMFLNKLKTESKENIFTVVVIDYLIKSRGMNTTTAVELLPKIKSVDDDIEVIIFADSDNIELKATGSKMKPAAYIKKDSQYFVRLEATINRIISEYELEKKKNNLKLALISFLSIIAFGVIILLLIQLFFYEKF